MAFAPNTETFSAVHPISVAAAIGRARYPGVLRGRSRIEFIVSPLSRRRHNESHFAAQSPERSFFFPLFLSAEKEKEVIGGAVTKSLSVKRNVTFAGTNALARYTSSGGIRRHLPLEGKAKSGRAARIADERFLPECRNFLRCAQHLCCLSLPACPFPRGSRGAEPH